MRTSECSSFKKPTMAVIFSIPAFFIVLREVLEACLVVGIIIAYLDKIGATQYRRWVWYGVIAGILASLATGVAFAVVFFVTGDQIFSGKAEKIFEGVTFLLAALLLTWMIFWMMSTGHRLREEMETQIERIINSGGGAGRVKLSLFSMVFFQVFREGIETVIFLIGSAGAEDVGGWRAIPLPGILALILGVSLSYFVFMGMVQLDMLRVLSVSSYLLIAFAAGLTSHAFHELQEVDLFGDWKPAESRDWYNATMWSTKSCCNDKTNQFFAMLRALFGYQDTPTFVEVSTYFAYWALILGLFVYVNWNIISADHQKAKQKAQMYTSFSMLFTFVGFIFTMINTTWIGVLTMTVGFILSLFTASFLFEFISNRLKMTSSLKNNLALVSGIMFSLYTLLCVVLHLVQMECIGTEKCELNLFFFFGLIFDEDWAAEGREEKSWNSIGVLSGSFVITAFFFGVLSFYLILLHISEKKSTNRNISDSAKPAENESNQKIDSKNGNLDSETV